MAIMKHKCCVCGRTTGKDTIIPGDKDLISHGYCDPTAGRDCVKAVPVQVFFRGVGDVAYKANGNLYYQMQRVTKVRYLSKDEVLDRLAETSTVVQMV